MTEQTLNVRLDKDTKQMIKELAQSDNRTMSNYIKNLVQKEYEKLKKGVSV